MTKAAPASRRARLLRRMVAGLLVVAGAGMVFVMVWAWRTLPQTRGEVAVPGISGPVEIWRDGSGIPHIFADSAADAWFALGYVHAQDRMWQMEFTRRLGAGRLAEVLGEPGLQGDRFMRTLGLYRLAEAQAKSLAARTQLSLQSYASGVNAWLAHRAAALPPEFALLRVEPEPWQVADSLVWGRLLAYQLSVNWPAELFRARLSRRLPKALVVELWPGDAPGAPVTLGSARGASNVWVVGPKRSKTGAPILANDPHLALSAPNRWYLARIVTPEFETTGATAPGTPFTVLGHNGRVAWGMTSLGADTQDLFIEQLDPADANRYLTPDGPRDFNNRREMILVRGEAPVELWVRRTRHGPVISEFLADMDAVAGMNAVVALASTSESAEDPSAGALTAMAMAPDAEAFESAATDFRAPPVNIFYADIDGSIGMTAPARIPVRRAGDGSLPALGADGRQDWIGLIPQKELPHVRNPDSGYLVNANNRPVGADYPWFIARDWPASFRARRIVEILEALPRHTPEDSMALQADILSDAARLLLPIMLEQVGRVDGNAARAVAMLRAWDLKMVRDRPEPLIYAAWLRETMRGMTEAELGPLFRSYWRARPRFVEAALTRNRHWCGDAFRDVMRDCGLTLRLALEAALGDIESQLGGDIAGWRWGDLHRARFRHQVFTNTPPLSWIADLSIATGGGDHTVSVGKLANSGSTDPFSHVHGASFRAVYDLADLASSRFMAPAGQSGNPFSPHYRDLLEPWRDGDYIAIAGSREELDEAGYELLVLTPDGAR